MRIILLLMMIIFSINTFGAIVLGNPKGKVTLIEVFDYQCIYCHKSYPDMMKLIDNNPDLSVRLMPVAILNQSSLYEASAAIAASRYPGKFQEFNNAALSGGVLSENQISNVLDTLQLNSDEFKKAMHSQAVEDQLIQGLKFLQYTKTSTPLFIVFPTNNAKVSAILKGKQTYAVMQTVVDEARNYK